MKGGVDLKAKYGEVLSPESLVNEMLDMLPGEVFDSSGLWVDPGAGEGIFGKTVIERLGCCGGSGGAGGGAGKVKMVEINKDNVDYLKSLFGDGDSGGEDVIWGDYLSMDAACFDREIDVIIGNPPFNSGGIKKVPANKKSDKKKDGLTCWVGFVRKSLELLREGGYLCMITPAIWLKPDKAGIYDLLCWENTLLKMRGYSCVEANKIFNYSCQTPVVLFVVKKGVGGGGNVEERVVSCYDKFFNGWAGGGGAWIDYKLVYGEPIPMKGHYIFNKILRGVNGGVGVGERLKVYKTNMPPKKAIIKRKKEAPCFYSNIKTCVLLAGGAGGAGVCDLVIEYSDIPLAFFGVSKIVMAHKRLGCPVMDFAGNFGLSTRDNYVITVDDYTIEELDTIYRFLNTRLVKFLFECVKYRMNYLEKYVFQLLPDVTKLSGFPVGDGINDLSVEEYFNVN